MNVKNNRVFNRMSREKCAYRPYGLCYIFPQKINWIIGVITPCCHDDDDGDDDNINDQSSPSNFRAILLSK